MLHTFFFSPSDTTRKYAKAMTEAFGEESQLIDLTHGPCEFDCEPLAGDTALLLAPVYVGRIPAMAADLFRQIDGHGMKAIVAVVYGNRDYDDALLELADIATENSFEVVAAGAFIAQHCIFPKVANGRPDASDMAIAIDFIKRAKESDKFINPDVEFDLEAQNYGVPNWLADTGCLNVLNFDRFLPINAYIPYANAADEECIKIRQRWDYEIHEYLESLARRKPLVVCGDLNIVATEKDAWNGVAIKNAGCFFDWEHRNFDSLCESVGIVDTYRHLHPDGSDHSYFFQNKPEYRLLNQGFRIDYCLMSEELLPYLTKSEILTDVTDTTNNPILIEINIL